MPTFSGHTDKFSGYANAETDARWCLHDGSLAGPELAELLAVVADGARVVIVADTCYAAAFTRVRAWPCTVVVLAACGERQITLNTPVSEFIVRLEQLVLTDGGVRKPECTSYTWLRDRLRCRPPPLGRAPF